MLLFQNLLPGVFSDDATAAGSPFEHSPEKAGWNFDSLLQRHSIKVATTELVLVCPKSSLIKL